MKRLLFIICASLLDGILSLWLFSNTTSSELNPLVAYLLSYGPWVFIIGKMLLTIGCGVILQHLSKKFTPANIALSFISMVYGALLIMYVTIFIL